MVNIKGKGDIHDNKSISGDGGSIDSHTVNGNSNVLVVGDGSSAHIYQSQQIKEGVMYQLLNNIGNLSVTLSRVELPDLVPYTVEEKISFNQLEVYRDEFDTFQDANYIIKDKIFLVERNSNANFSDNICMYVQVKFREISYELRERKNLRDGDCLIANLREKIVLELKEHYQGKLSPEELIYVDYVIYYVFTKCKIFKKPPQKPC